MNRFDWLSDYQARLQDEGVVLRHKDATTLAPAYVLGVAAENWGTAARLAAAFGY